MSDTSLINKLKKFILEVKEEEDFCNLKAKSSPSQEAYFRSYGSGITEFRVKLESLLENECGASRSITIDASKH
ncbi:hypothetical protein VFMJ11_B0027 (plasmid) [Aliivibrio fischeri MJ11]|uniref:Uncharacterized protein n=1 Tax=Aliivibrio fischeri (strain MJ11) TaxID=388396 RepID=B5EVX0_ALIFM|nr:hypothetical protein [Aliivibrio fischeri]ACH64736.1 hypothetical protein VFMJ11_B0027 [Aliivibrio fischeri MJ11]